jgi:uncharacterized protein (TIGR03435 family)
MRPLLCLLLSAAAYGQFEAASVKPSAADARGRSSMKGGPGTGDPGRITYRNVTLAVVLQRAYDVKRYQVSGPDWMSSERYEIVASLPPESTLDQFRAMLQKLLAERFALSLRHVSREFPGYELITGRNGSKLKAPGAQSPTPGPPFPPVDGAGLAMMEGVKGKAVVSFLAARAQPLSALVDLLSREFRMPIVDHTGLSGIFDFTLEFAPQPPGSWPPPRRSPACLRPTTRRRT